METHNENLDLLIEDVDTKIYKLIESENYQKDLKTILIKKCLLLEEKILEEFEMSSRKVLRKHINLNGYKLSNSMKIRERQICQVQKNLRLLSGQKIENKEGKINKLKDDLKYLKLVQQSEINKK